MNGLYDRPRFACDNLLMRAADSDLDAFSKVVSSIYAAAMDPSKWQTTLCEVVDAFGARGGAMLVARPGNTAFATDVGMDPAAVESYNEHYFQVDPIAQFIEASSVGTVAGVFDVLSEADRSCSEFYQDWALPSAAGDGVFCRFSDRGDGPGWVQVVTEPPKKFGTPGRLNFMRELVPHLSQAAKLKLTLDDEARGLTPTTDALEHLDRGALLADGDGNVHEANPAGQAILHSGDGLSVDNHRSLLPAFAHDRAVLHQVIASACGRGVTIPRAGSALISRPSGRRPYVLHALPLECRSSDGRRLALVTIVDPDAGARRSTVEAWRNLYGFTWRESVIAQHVLHGEGLQAVADELQITLSTVRVHLRHIFEKTGTHRQAELARLLTAIGPIFTGKRSVNRE